jgi:hypothetical protein
MFGRAAGSCGQRRNHLTLPLGMILGQDDCAISDPFRHVMPAVQGISGPQRGAYGGLSHATISP